MPQKIPADIERALEPYPGRVARRLKQMRRIILKVAAGLDIGEVVETTKWGEPAYLPAKARTGTTVRLGAKADLPGGGYEHCRMYVNCQTSLIKTYKTLFPEFSYEGNRGVLFPLEVPLPEDEFAMMVEAALTYHLRKRAGLTT